MGSNWSKLKKAVERGDESKALEIYSKNQDIRRKLNANSIINEYSLDTYMHTCAKYGMTEFLKLLLYENNGNPNKQNRHKQTVLHKICQGQVDSTQYECMKLLLQWRDPNQTSNNHVSSNLKNSASELKENKSDNDRINVKNIQTDVNINAKDEVSIFIFISLLYN